MRIKALIIRILRQFLHDKRTVGLMIFAPILILTMLNLVFNGDEYVPDIGLVNVPDLAEDVFNNKDANTLHLSEQEAQNLLENQELDGYLLFDGGQLVVRLEGSDPSVNGSVMKWVQNSAKSFQGQEKALNVKTEYLNGSEDMGQFDYFGPVLLGFFAFFFVFLVAGVSFLRERTGGTLERLICSPLHLWEIVVGYVAGFGIFTLIQSSIIAAYAIYGLGMLMEGAFLYVLLVITLLSFSALTLGILLSAFANNELQMIQFIPLIIVPQVFFSGLFNLETISDWLSWISYITPLYYAADALRSIMVRGMGWEAISGSVSILLCFSLLFMILNIAALKKYRKM
ncbi:ABC transporter permease [Bacillus sp. M6-12]|uniref:ABC transporter permease n=1 Tax=Bacillus sp. M6-12 TaxID=2054166 RepID=UPI000C78DFB9|nr:ABC transporter permease [Bacillus sp. M6-12]PLS18407.1 ABC transporter permease [Bacillus sp. M6-12]